MDHQFHLIFHIGAGKTGTSSIQASLLKAKSQLIEHGWDYWGLMLEHAPHQQYPWQKKSALKEFFHLGEADLRQQLTGVIENSIQLSKKRGVNTAIWSNEGFFRRHASVIPALQLLESKGVRITIVAYVRNHAAWAKSAYIQWGIKHKNYNGPLMPFKTYIQKHPVGFAAALYPWLHAFSRSSKICNFDTMDDAVVGFARTAGLPFLIQSTRMNESPTPEELFLRALFNNGVATESRSVEFNRMLPEEKIDSYHSPDEWLRSLLPSQKDLQEVIVNSSSDLEAVNLILVENGEPPLVNKIPVFQEVSIDYGKLCMLLAQIVLKQNLRMNFHQKQINKILNKD